jgi:hypothetical protein
MRRGKTGRPPFSTEVTLHIHWMQEFFGHFGHERGLERDRAVEGQHPDVKWQMAMIPGTPKALGKKVHKRQAVS